MEIREFVTFLDAMNDPEKYQAKLKVLVDAEAALRTANETKAKGDKVDVLLQQAKDALDKAQQDADQIKKAAQVEANGFVQRAKDALAEAEQLKLVASQKASAARAKETAVVDSQKELETAWADLQTQKQALAAASIASAGMQVEIEARLAKLRSVMTQAMQ